MRIGGVDEFDVPVVIVTGASRGIGRAIADWVARFGARVVLTSRTRADLETVATTCRAHGAEVRVVALDLTHPEGPDRVLEAAASWGRIDALVNNAAVVEPVAHVADVEADGLERNLAVSFTAPAKLMSRSIPALRRTGGRIVNVTSDAAGRSPIGLGPYSSAKAALEQLTRVAAVEEPDLTILNVAPGVVDTHMHAVLRRQDAVAMSASRVKHFRRLHQEGGLSNPSVPGRQIAALALGAPPSFTALRLQVGSVELEELADELFGYRSAR